jgi:cell wall-associated NlpC family hydrolase
VNIDNMTGGGPAGGRGSLRSGRLPAVRPRTGAVTVAALSVLAGGMVLGAPGVAFAAGAPGAASAHSGGTTEGATASARHSGPVVEWTPALARATRSSLSVDKASVLSGQSIVFSGRVVSDVDSVSLRNQSVRLEQETGGAWKTVAAALADADGSVTFTVKPTASANYRLHYAGVRAFGASTSPAQAVTVTKPAPVTTTKTSSTVTTTRSSSSSSNWAPAGASVIGSNHVQPSATALAVVEAASREAGKPYVFGAAGPNAFDCSGLTMYVFRQFGVSLPHSADQQKRYGTPVSAADAAPGDLIIFLDGGYGYHAAIYAGGNKMWDAPNSRSTVGLHTIWSTNVIFRRLV